MSGLNFLNKLLDGVDVEWLSLGELGDFIRGNGLQKKDFVESGFPAIHYGQIYTRYGLSADKTFTYVLPELANKLRKAQKNDLLLATTSENDEDVVKPLAWLGDNVAISGDMMLFRHEQNVKYLAYFFQSEIFQTQKMKYITGAKVRRVSSDDLSKIKIPIPSSNNPEKSLTIQSEIVRILDKFTALTAELTAELTMRKKQYNYYRDKLLSFEEGEVEWKTLGDIGDVRMCKRILKNETQPEGDVPFYKIGTFGKKANAFISRDVFEAYKNKYSFPKKGDILISASGTIGRTVIYDGEPAYFQDSNIVWLENDESIVTNKYLWHFYKIAKWAVSEGGTIDRLYNDNIRKTKIIVPYPSDSSKSLAEQNRVVAILDKFDALTSSISEGLPREIELRQKQYEYYRDLLFSFPRPETASN
ncbi:TPA: restriction endonuclease subunit S [Klebsiella pneumoniae]|uniref:restriction endonuclease subunit S n=1 Tax=Klebsiella TaxID=570 RepID=UPI000D7CC649|nr:restriction endonuclease subunit S [Klebsiella pneumoniae]HDS9498291.1 restriction endonuclease subunit S [Klebsiella pneumoniae subsp. pneumoniae]EIV7286288.1 restriction endonuclease subunit S [Klebsiella pneumoniae]EIW8727025.1 restriction endonuclease subunit S [Klebsiella pneumoniae]ELA0949472.1 restriction endonuclease subunit S [Klebsiella pneumoniae]MBE3055079.1 restriction endonuclease subunit S [Klebsiella pneumoniae]